MHENDKKSYVVATTGNRAMETSSGRSHPGTILGSGVSITIAVGGGVFLPLSPFLNFSVPDFALWPGLVTKAGLDEAVAVSRSKSAMFAADISDVEPENNNFPLVNQCCRHRHCSLPRGRIARLAIDSCTHKQNNGARELILTSVSAFPSPLARKE